MSLECSKYRFYMERELLSLPFVADALIDMVTMNPYSHIRQIGKTQFIVDHIQPGDFVICSTSSRRVHIQQRVDPSIRAQIQFFQCNDTATYDMCLRGRPLRPGATIWIDGFQTDDLAYTNSLLRTVLRSHDSKAIIVDI